MPPESPPFVAPASSGAATSSGPPPEAAAPALIAAALAQLSEGVIVTDVDGRITYVNEAAARLHGVRRLDVPPEAYTEAYHLLTEDGRPYPPAELPLARAVLRGETVLDARWRIRRPDGSEIVAAGSARPVLGSDGRQQGAVLTLRDDTARDAAAGAERRAARLLTQIGDAHVTLDHAFRFVAVNPAAERLIGKPEAELLGRTHWEVFPASVAAEPERQYRRVQAEGVEAHFAHHYVGDGYDSHIEIDAYPTEGDARTRGVAIFWRDVTDRARAVAALRVRAAEAEAGERQARFLADLGQALQPLADPDAIMAETARRLGEHLGVDRCAYAEVEADADHFTITGNYTRGDTASILGRFAFHAFGTECLRLMRADVAYVVDDVASDERITVEDGAAYEQTDVRAVICVPLHKVGCLVAAMAVHQRVPRRWSEAEVALVVTVVHRCWESLERARAVRRLEEREAALAASERQFRTLADAIPTLAWTARADGHIDWYNARWYEYTGTTPEEMEGWGWQAVHDPAVLPDVLARWRGCITTGAVFEMTFPLRGADGRFRPFLTRVVPLRDGDGRVVRWFGTNADVSSEREARAAAERAQAAAEQALTAAEAANRAKSDFLAMMSHELRTPLNAIGGYAELLALEVRGPLTDAQRDDLARLRRANQHLTALVTDVLNFARLEARQVHLHAEELEVGALIADLEAMMGPQIAAKGLRFDHDGCAPDTPDRPHRVRTDGEKLRQILLNLLTNAMKFTAPGGEIALVCDTDAAAGVVRLAVRDTGRGIAAEHLERIFDPFVQVDRTRVADNQQGLGLGLAISRELARAMGGDLVVESTVGVGSTFILTLPHAPTTHSDPAPVT